MAAKKQVDTAVAKSQKIDQVKSQKVDQAKNMDAIEVMGARVHNLKNVSVAFPRGKFIVVTGVSGSGKSSLTIDTLFAEGQRRYAESLSAYARQFMARMEKPDVDMIKGLCPAIAVEQKVITRTPRSTVGSMTEIYDYLRLLFARAGKTISPVSGKEVKKDEVSDVVAAICALPKNSKVVIGVASRRVRHFITKRIYKNICSSSSRATHAHRRADGTNACCIKKNIATC
jgi:excinuclease ABC subunit A